MPIGSESPQEYIRRMPTDRLHRSDRLNPEPCSQRAAAARSTRAVDLGYGKHPRFGDRHGGQAKPRETPL
ncbi:hypothetical protein V7x_20910 [Crateriforma conspicua]|uniref:Uncharacterized protein n=1 Tax=Crateriforma conspicua TaxID=2527996 RepID=A0A5C6FVY8_9PLAN|nr:hypothetical protein Mal65_33020 [Crateriforma conspicua]TWU66524.1 hypothetical protein V7x_20910 [Crateriforma conspicua]